MSKFNGYSNRPFAALAMGNAKVTKSQQSSTNGRELERLPAHSVDGVDHINVSPHAKTDLGHALTMECRINFNHPDFGPFASVRGFAHWVKSKNFDDNYRVLSERKVTDYYLQNKNDQITIVDNFYYMLAVATYHKIKSNPVLRDEVINSTLPFEMYRVRPIQRGQPAYGVTRERDMHARAYIPILTIIRAALQDQLTDDKAEPDFSHLIENKNSLNDFIQLWKNTFDERKAEIEKAKQERVKNQKAKRFKQTQTTKDVPQELTNSEALNSFVKVDETQQPKVETHIQQEVVKVDEASVQQEPGVQPVQEKDDIETSQLEIVTSEKPVTEVAETS